jgi:SAM-dependent methyltransferase
MKQNKYDDNKFFNKYSQMERSTKGLESAGEWHILKNMLPSFKDKKVLDLGCGFGWHCRYASEKGATSVLGIDISQKMLARAKESTNNPNVEYMCMAIEEIEFSKEKFDVVISSLVFHYIKDFDKLCKNIYNIITDNGDFIFSVEHPIFTANESQDWYYSKDKEILHWPIDNYQSEGRRETKFLGEDVVKYHRTCETYINILIENGFSITRISEPVPPQRMVDENRYFKNEFRRPMFLMISAKRIQK